METHWAAEQLQVIRTIMERAAVYRRALAPLMTVAGVIGTVAAVAGGWLGVEGLRAFTIFWMAVGAVTLLSSLMLVRWQALKAAEPFWSLPTRRIAQALLPPFFAGLLLSLGALAFPDTSRLSPGVLTAVWMVLYACGLHSAGFFMSRGIRLFSWVFLLAGCILVSLAGLVEPPPQLPSGHLLMGLTFGVLHLAYGIYLYFTENRGRTL